MRVEKLLPLLRAEAGLGQARRDRVRDRGDPARRLRENQRHEPRGGASARGRSPAATTDQPVWKRIVVIGAGPAVNIALAFVILFFVDLGLNARDRTQTVGTVVHRTPRRARRCKPGDRILAVDGQRYPKPSPRDAAEALRRRHRLAQVRRRAEVDGCQAATPVRACDRARRAGLTHSRPARLRRQASGRMLVGFSYRHDRRRPRRRRAPLGGPSDAMWFVTTERPPSSPTSSTPRSASRYPAIVGVSDVAHQTVEFGATEALILLALVSLSLGLINLLPLPAARRRPHLLEPGRESCAAGRCRSG